MCSSNDTPVRLYLTERYFFLSSNFLLEGEVNEFR